MRFHRSLVGPRISDTDVSLSARSDSRVTCRHGDIDIHRSRWGNGVQDSNKRTPGSDEGNSLMSLACSCIDENSCLLAG